MKIVVSANSLKHLLELLEMKIDGVILYIDGLSVNSSFYIDRKIYEEIDFKDKEVFICLNKNIHNKDIDYLKEVIKYFKNKNVRILFYDMAVYNIALEFKIENRLIVYQDHLNASILSNRFYYNLGIRGSFVTNDITLQELIDIKKNTKMDIMFLAYGYQPIFYSRRYLISNYLKYRNISSGKKYEIIGDDEKYPIIEEDEGTTIYTSKEINLINYLHLLSDIDYIVLNSVNILDDRFNEMVLKFINRDKIDEECYLGFFNTKTIYKIK